MYIYIYIYIYRMKCNNEASQDVVVVMMGLTR